MKKPWQTTRNFLHQYSQYDPETKLVSRHTVKMKAAPGVTAQDILDELYSIVRACERMDMSTLLFPLDQRPLMTTLGEDDHIAVSLTVGGFTDLAEAMKKHGGSKESLAQELIFYRDKHRNAG